MNDRRTTFAGIGAILAAIGSLVTAYFDGDPATVPNFTAAAAAVIAGIGLIFAKDSPKSDA